MLVYFPWIHQTNRVLISRTLEYDKLDKIREWVISQNPSKHKSTHWWYRKLPTDICLTFSKIAMSDTIIKMFKDNLNENYCIDILNDMNEIYVTAPTSVKDSNTSDKIFYTRHIDGPYYLFPFASCYRLIIGLDDNSNVITCFNMVPEKKLVKKGDIVAFDFHRECHYIYTDNDNFQDELRVIMKVHYCVYPRWAYYFGKSLGLLSIYYNKSFRKLFLFTLISNKIYKGYLSSLMIFTTRIVHDTEYYIGYNNISFILILYYLSYLTDYTVFLFGSSFIHYFRKIDSIKNNCDNLVLVRDIRFYYTIYTLQLYYIYYNCINANTLIISQLLNTILYVLKVDSLSNIIKIYEIFTLLLIFCANEACSVNFIFFHLHLIMNYLEYQMIVY